jgi:hypothetical protein
MQAYRNVGHTDAIIKQTKWNSIVYFFGELVRKHPESHALKLFSKELLHFDEVQALMASYSFSEISGIQALMGILSACKGDSQVKTWVSNHYEVLEPERLQEELDPCTCMTLMKNLQRY